MKLSMIVALACVAVFLVGSPLVMAFAVVTVTADENGNGTFMGNPLQSYVGQDSGPGGFPNALVYMLPVPALAGDVLVQEPPGWDPTEEYSDVLRFNDDGTMVFYSAVGDADLADVGLPTVLYQNPVTVMEVGTEQFNWFDYVATPGMPGYIAGYDPTSYHVISDIPEPATFSLLALGGLALLRRRR